jgi:peptidyl-prolyl cis-trans isomerase D
MLKILRDNLKYLSWILWIVMLVFIAFVFVDFGGGLSRGQKRTAPAATVGNLEVSRREFERRYRQIETQYRQALGEQWSSEMADRLQLPARALESLVDREIKADEAHRRGIRVSDADVEKAILDIDGMRDTSGRFVGEETYQRFLRSLGYSPREFEEAVRTDLAIERLSELVDTGVAIPDSEVEKAWRDQHESASIRYLLVPAARYQAEAAPSEAEIEAYFKTHPEQFHLPDQRVVSYLLVDTAKLRAAVTVDDADLEREYQARQSDFQLPEQVHARHILIKVDEHRSTDEAKKKIAEIRAKLDQGTPFEKLAEEYSEDPGSKAHGGDLGNFGRGQMVPAFEEAAFAATPGSVVGPIETSFGIHLIQVLEHTPARTRTLAEATPELRARLTAQRAQELAETKARDLAQRIASAKPATDEAWQAFGDGNTVVALTTPPFGKDDALPGIGRNPDFAAAAFALAPGAFSQPVRVPRGWAILRLVETKPAHDATLTEVEARVRSAAQRDKANRLAMAELERVRVALTGGKTLADAAKSLGLETQESGEFHRDGAIGQLGSAPEVAQSALALDPGAIGGPVQVAQGSVLFQVESRTRFDPTQFAAERDTTREQLRKAEADRLMAAFVERRRGELGVRYDRDLVERMKMNVPAAS